MVGKVRKVVERWGRTSLEEVRLVVQEVDDTAVGGGCCSVGFHRRVRIPNQIGEEVERGKVFVLGVRAAMERKANSDETRLRFRRNEGFLLFPSREV